MAITGKIVEVMFEKALETYEHQMDMLSLVDFFQPEAGTMQNAGNFIWRPVQQHAPIITGWDLTGQETDIIEETYPAVLGTPANDFIQQRADDLRDMRFWERRGEQSGKRQATELNQRLAEAIKNQGSMYYAFSTASSQSGYEFIAQAQALMNERQLAADNRCFLLNDRDNLIFGSDLAGRQTLQGRPEQVWKTGQIGQNIAGFDVYTGSFLPNLRGSGTPVVTGVTGDQSFKPEGGSVSGTGVVGNVDYRIAAIPVTDSSSFQIGDKIDFDLSSDPVRAIGLADKTDTNIGMTFSVVGIPDGTTLQVYPKPIANDDPALSVVEKAYSNVNTQILDTYSVRLKNIFSGNKKVNLFWDKSAVEVLGGTVPAHLFQQFAGFKVLSHTMKNGQTMYMIYDGDIATMTFRYRIFTWYGITVSNPSACGIAITT